MMLIFPLVYLFSFILAVREFIRGNMQGILLYLIFGLSIYTTALSVTFNMGLRDLLLPLQFFKELIIAGTFAASVWYLKRRLRFHFIDYAVLAFFIYTLIYALFPIGEQGFMNRMLAFKTTSFFALVYFTGRFFNPAHLYISKYFHYIMLLAIATAVLLLYEIASNQHLQSLTGYADYNYYIFNFEPSGHYGLSWTFESEGGFKRFASFFASPLEHAGATLIALAVIAAVYTNDEYKFKLDTFGWLALGATLLSIIFAISRSAFISYFIMIYFYCLFTRRTLIIRSIHISIVVTISYLIFLLTQNEDYDGLVQDVILNTINFTHPSSIGHVVEWVQGILSIVQNPLGIGLGSSGRIGGSLGENIGGENQYIIIGVQAGIIALALYMAVYISFIKTARKWYYKLSFREKQLCLAILLIKIGFIIPSLTSETESSVYISYLTWFLSGIFISMISEKISTDKNVKTTDNRS